MKSEFQILEVNRNIRLKILDKENINDVFNAIEANRFRLREWLGWVDSTVTAQDLEKFIIEGQEGFKENKVFRYGIFYDNKFAGIVELQKVDYSNKKSTIGYWLANEYEGRGVMSQSVSAVLDLAFKRLKLNRIELYAATGNLKSNKVALRLGFKKEGIMRQDEWLYDHFIDRNIYSLLKSEWK